MLKFSHECKISHVPSYRVKRIPAKCQEAAAPAARSTPTTVSTSNLDKIMMTFRWPAALGGSRVAVSGNFNGWTNPVQLNRSSETGDFVRSVALKPGVCQFKFYVDDQWRISPVDNVAPGANGLVNNQRVVTPSATFKWLNEWGGNEVMVTGNFAAWGELLPLNRNGPQDDFILKCSLPPGSYNYQYLVDGKWTTSPGQAVSPDDEGHQCNRVDVAPVTSFRIFYATGWNTPILRYKVLSDDPAAKQEWQQRVLIRAPSRANPNGGKWYYATIPILDEPKLKNPKLQFYVHQIEEEDERDVPRGGGYYTCKHPGGYKLVRGQLKPFLNAIRPPAMVVSDLDGTMVDPSSEGIDATAAFCEYWENNAALSGCKLVYNTGRSLGQFTYLWQSMDEKLSLPDVLITAVGTKIFLLGEKDTDRGRTSGVEWKEDLAWSKRLDEGWDVNKVRQVADRFIQENSVSWLDKGTEHPHRVALSVQVEALERVRRGLEEGFKNEGVKVRIIISGEGEWRYVDCVSSKGGKLEALEYVRTIYGIPRERTVACGDSGNDVLMLDGKNPGIIVGNAQPELVGWLVEQTQEDGRVIMTDGRYARGILEGLARHGLY